MKLTRIVAASILVTATLVASRPVAAQAKGAEGLTVPVPSLESPRRSLRDGVGTWLLVGGGALLVGGWGTNALAGFGAGWGCTRSPYSGGLYGGGGYGSCQHDAEWASFREWSLAPVVGPYAQLAGLPDGGRDNGWTGWLIASAIIQTSGIALLLAGLIAKLGADEATRTGAPQRGISVSPSISPDGGGLSIGSTF